MNSNVQNESEYRVNDPLAQQFLTRHAGLTFKIETGNTYDGILNEYVNWLYDNDHTVLSASSEDVRAFLETCVIRGNRLGTLSSKLSTIRELYRFIHLETNAKDELELDPLRLRTIDLSEYNTPPKIQRKNLSRNEIRKLFDAFNSYRNRLMAIVGIETGLRNSDIRGLRLQDIYDDYIHVHQPKGSRPYDVPISESLSWELDYWGRHVRGGYSYAEQSEYVFPSHQGERLQSNGSFTKIIKDAAERAGIQKVIGKSELNPEYVESRGLNKSYREWYRVTPHTLRHSYVTLLHDAGVDITYRMLVANHRNAETNLGYTHGQSDVVKHIRSKFDPPR